MCFCGTADGVKNLNLPLFVGADSCVRPGFVQVINGEARGLLEDMLLSR